MPKKFSIFLRRLVEGPGPRTQLPHSRRPAPSLVALPLPCGAGSTGLRPSMLRTVMERSCCASPYWGLKLHGLHAPAREVLVVLELVGVVLQQPARWPAASPCPRARRAPSRAAVRCRPRPPVVARSFFSVWSHGKESWQGVVARSYGKESWQGVSARSHCKESLQGVIARSHGKESLQGVMARSHCKESLQGVIARSHCKES